MDCNQNCSKGSLCACLIISLIVGIVVGVLFFFGFIPVIVATWIVLGLAVLNLIFLVYGAFSASVRERSGLSKCLCKQGVCFLVSIISTIVLSIIVLSATVVAGVIFSIIIGLLAFSAVLMLCQMISLIKCVICRLCRKHCDNDIC